MIFERHCYIGKNDEISVSYIFLHQIGVLSVLEIFFVFLLQGVRYVFFRLCKYLKLFSSRFFAVSFITDKFEFLEIFEFRVDKTSFETFIFYKIVVNFLRPQIPSHYRGLHIFLKFLDLSCY